MGSFLLSIFCVIFSSQLIGDPQLTRKLSTDLSKMQRSLSAQYLKLHQEIGELAREQTRWNKKVQEDLKNLKEQASVFQNRSIATEGESSPVLSVGERQMLENLFQKTLGTSLLQGPVTRNQTGHYLEWAIRQLETLSSHPEQNPLAQQQKAKQQTLEQLASLAKRLGIRLPPATTDVSF